MLKLVAVLLWMSCGLLSSASADETQKSEGNMNLEVFAVDKQSFVEGNLYFIAYHEMAHALVSEFELPVIGREEDAADRLAIMLMTPENKKEEPEYLLGAVQGWFATGAETELKDIPWWDEHGTDNQRAYQIACLLYGSDEVRYKKIADSVDLPDERRESCVSEAAQNSASWNKLTDPHEVANGAKMTEPKIPVTYAATEKYADDLAYLKQIELLEDISKFMTERYSFKPGIKIVADECEGEPNAFWKSDDRTLTMCYELVRDFRRLAKK